MLKRTAVLLMCIFASYPLFAEIRIAYVAGEVKAYRNNEWIEAKSGMFLFAQNEIRTGAGGMAAIDIDGSSRVWVKENTAFKISSVYRGSIFNLIKGKIRARIREFRGKFQVKTPVAVLSVRGTEFVFTDSGRVAVIDGTVEFLGVKESRKIEVSQGQSCSLDADGAIGKISDMTPQDMVEIVKEWAGFEQYGVSAEIKPRVRDSKKEPEPAQGGQETGLIIPEPENQTLEEASPSEP